MVLDAPAEVMFDRKGEQGIRRLQASRDLNLAMVDRFRDVVVLNAARSPDEVRREATAFLSDRWAQKP